VNILSHFIAASQQAHAQALHHLFRYLRGNNDYGLHYRQGKDSTLLDYVDANWAGDRNDRKSNTGYMFHLWSIPRPWQTHKQPCVALSFIESEYMAVSSTARKASWIRRLLTELKLLEITQPTKIRCDNQSAIKLAENLVFHTRTKHIETQHHYIKEQVQGSKLKLTHVSSIDQSADIFTKPLRCIIFERLRSHLSLVHTSPPEPKYNK
jgi:hypothetical protein